MKRAIGLFMCLLMVAGCLSVSQADVGESERKEVTEVTEEVTEVIENTTTEYLTDEQLAQLYTCKQDVRKEDSSIIELSQTDAWLLMKLAQCEAGGCATSQYLEMMVVINRLKSDEFPNSIKEIIYQDGQFSVVEEGKFDKTEPTVDSHIALSLVERGIDTSQGAIWVESSSNSDSSWHNQNKTFLYEMYGQRFYK